MTTSHAEKKEKIRFANFSKSFGDLLVLDRLDFSIAENAFIGIVGPTGCGKTTLCNVISTLLPPSEGFIEISGKPADPQKHNISFVFQEPSCLPWCNVRENIKFGIDMKRAKAKDDEDTIETIIKLIGLKGFEKHYPHEISSGMQQRVAIARAFVTKPDLLLMDEPFGQLDIKTRFHMMDEVLRLWKEIKATILYVTHNIEEAVYLGEQILVMSQKPTTIKKIVPVDLPHPRDYADPEFVKIRKEVTELIKWW